MKFAERKKRPSYGIAVLSLFLILVLTACGSGSSYQAASPSAEAKASYDGEAYADNYAAAEAAYDTADAAGGAEAGSHGEENATEPAESKQKLIYTCSMEIQTLTFAETAQKIHEVIRQYDGIIESESRPDSDYEWYKDESAKRRSTLSSFMVIRIPTEKYEDFLAGIEGTGGKITMLENGCFRDIDVALAVHSCCGTSAEIKAIASTSVDVTFHGREAHAALCPEAGRSALDALLLTFQGLEFMREHVREDSRMHYTVTDAGGEANVVPKEASGNFCLRSYSTNYLDNEIMPRFYDIVKGAALMAGVTYDCNEYGHYQSQVAVLTLNDAMMKNASAVGAERITEPRQKTGSTDFGNVSQVVPSACLRIACVPQNVAAHSREYVLEGKTDFTHAETVKAAKILAATAYDLIADNNLLSEVKADFERARRS